LASAFAGPFDPELANMHAEMPFEVIHCQIPQHLETEKNWPARAFNFRKEKQHVLGKMRLSNFT